MKGNPRSRSSCRQTGVVAGVYVQAISAYAPHPNAAKLWMEYLYSDEGQLGWLKGYCHPIRFNDLAKNGKIPADLLAKLPPADLCQGRLPDARRAGGGQGRDHQAVGLGRRRQRPVAPFEYGVVPERSGTTPIRGQGTGGLMVDQSAVGARPVIGAVRPAPVSWAWLGVAPFFLFALMFLILPTVLPGRRRLPQDPDGGFTLANIVDLFHRRSSGPTGSASSQRRPRRSLGAA